MLKLFPSELICSSLRIQLESISTRKITGVSTVISRRIRGLNMREINSARCMAQVLGMISPNMRTTKVKTPVAIPTALLPQRLMAKVVATEEADRLTILLPIRMALSILPYWSKMASTRMAPLWSSSAKVRSRTRLTVEKAVSAEEKKADKNTSTPSETSCMTPVVSNDFHSFTISIIKNISIRIRKCQVLMCRRIHI